MRYVESINKALHALMESDERVHVVGEDLLDPYGGAFKVTKGLSTRFPERVFSSPISEAAIVGLGTGMALRGLRPIVEIMFGDFITLCTDQLVNHASKFRWMYDDQVDVPLVVRTPMGGGRGYGATHSQSLESLFLGVPHLTIVNPSRFHDPGNMLREIVSQHSDPTLFFENKLLYPLQLDEGGDEFDRLVSGLDCPTCPTVALQMYRDEPAEIAVVAFGRMVELAVSSAAEAFMQRETLVQVIAPSLVKPVPIEDLAALAKPCHGLIVLEEGCVTGGIGAELACQMHERGVLSSGARIVRLGAEDLPIPSARPLEEQVFPTREELMRCIYEMARGIKRSAYA